MNAEFARYPEIVFINRRLIKTRFRRNLVLFCGINSEGKTLVIGVAFLKEDSQECFQFAIRSFLASVTEPPNVFIIERSSALRSAFQEEWPQLKLLYCPHNIRKSLIFQIKQLISKTPIKHSTSKLLNRIQTLPTIENFNLLNKEIEICKDLLNEAIQHEKLQCLVDVQRLFKKLYEEKQYWALANTVQEFTGGLNCQARNEIMR
jgi:hypothetical protein